jgi:hypothetical protein
MPSAVDTLNKLYTKVDLKYNKIRAVDVEKVEEKENKTNSSPFLTPTAMDVDYTGTPPDQQISPSQPYKTNANIGALPQGGGGHAAAQLPTNASAKPFDYSAPSGEEDEGKRKVMRTKDGEEFEVREQDETPIDPTEDEAPENTGTDMELPADPATTDPSMNAQQDPAMGGDMGLGGDMGGGMGMGGMEEEEKSPNELGRIYELKKIYTRLTSIESYLAAEADTELSEIRRFVSQSIELFEIVASNIGSYKDKMDDIIISYYKFLKEVYSQIRNYYKEKSEDK